MNVWVNLARGRKQASGPWFEVLSLLGAAVKARTITVPLSGTLYHELWHRGRMESREEVGALMRALSGFTTLAPVDEVRRREIAWFVARHFGLPASPLAKGEVLGVGAAHAFGSETGRFYIVESIETATDPEGAPAALPDDLRVPDQGDPAWEWFQLIGAPWLLDSPGLDRTPEHRRGDRYAEQERDFRRALEDDPAGAARLDDLVVTQELIDAIDDTNEACANLDVPPFGLFLETESGDPPTAMRAFAHGVPTIDVVTTLRQWKHRDHVLKWEQHDRADLVALAVAVPYCDAVVTERRWNHLLRASGLAGKYGTLVTSDAVGVEAMLEGLQPPPHSPRGSAPSTGHLTRPVASSGSSLDA